MNMPLIPLVRSEAMEWIMQAERNREPYLRAADAPLST
jgi:hypothetical protein